MTTPETPRNYIQQNCSNESNEALIFTYGTLKRGFPNHTLVQDLISKNEAIYLGTYTTIHELPLVIGPYGIPYLLNLPGSSSAHRVSGELYSVSTQGLVRLDELEGTSVGHFERLPIVVRADGDGEGAVVNAEAYYAHRSYAAEMWRRRGEKGLNAYTCEEAKEYLKIEYRPKDNTILDVIRLFLSSSSSD